MAGRQRRAATLPHLRHSNDNIEGVENIAANALTEATRIMKALSALLIFAVSYSQHKHMGVLALLHAPPRIAISRRTLSNYALRNSALFAEDKRYITPSDDVAKVEDITTGKHRNDINVISKEINGSSASTKTKQPVFMGIELTPDILAIMAIYFVEGALGLARLAQTFLLKDELHLGPAELSAISGILILPWTIKPLYGFLSDGFPLFGYRRRSYLILAGCVGFSSYAFLAYGLNTMGDESSMVLTITIALFMLSSASIAFSDVVADGIVVQKTREANERGDVPTLAGGLQSLCWGSAAIGGLISAYFSGSLLETMSPREVFGIASFLPLLVALMSLSIEEKPINKQEMSTDSIESTKQQLSALWEALRQPSIYKPVLFIFLWQATPTSEGAMLYFLTNDIGFGPEFLGRVRLVTAASSLFGVWLYQNSLRSVPIKQVLLWTSIISVPLGLTQLLLISHYNRELGIPDAAFVFGDDVVLSILGELAFLPTLVLAARLCPAGVEAVLFATLMSIYNGASTVGTEIGAGLTKFLGVTESDFTNLALLTIICNISSLLPLAFIGWLDGVGDESQNDIESKNQ